MNMHQQYKTLHMPVLDVKPPISKSWHLKGCYRVVAVLTCPSQNAGQTISIDQSWLPISENRFDDIPAASKSIKNVIPVLLDEHNSINRIMPVLHKYLRDHERDWSIIPVPFLFRPEILKRFLSENEGISLLGTPKFYNQIPIEDRPYINLLDSVKDPIAYKKLLDISISVLDDAGVDPAYYGLDSRKTDRGRIQDLLFTFPFLVHHIFEQLENLHVLRYRAMIYGVEETIAHIRYEPEYFYAVKKSKYLLDDLSHIVT